jgi:aldose sugar dehydrogenase
MSRILLILLLACAPAYAQFKVVKLVEGLEYPWSLAFLPDGRMLVTERPGRLRVITKNVLDPAPIAGLPQVTPHGQGGLHDVVLHPGFAHNGLLYFSFAEKGEDGVGTALARGRLVGNRLENVQVLFRQSPRGGTSAGASSSIAPAMSISRSATAAKWNARSARTTTPAR